MKLKELVDKYGEYTVPQELIEKLEPPQPKSVWDLKEGDKFTSIDVFGKTIENCTWEYNLFDVEMRKVGNVFLTRTEAERDIERRKVETLLLKHGGRRWFKDGVANWLIILAEEEDRLIWFIEIKPIQGVIYFDTEEQARKAIDEIGEERIRTALFDIRAEGDCGDVCS